MIEVSSNQPRMNAEKSNLKESLLNNPFLI